MYSSGTSNSKTINTYTVSNDIYSRGTSSDTKIIDMIDHMNTAIGNST